MKQKIFIGICCLVVIAFLSACEQRMNKGDELEPAQCLSCDCNDCIKEKGYEDVCVNYTISTEKSIMPEEIDFDCCYHNICFMDSQKCMKDCGIYNDSIFNPGLWNQCADICYPIRDVCIFDECRADIEDIGDIPFIEKLQNNNCIIPTHVVYNNVSKCGTYELQKRS